jgi:aminopeptidase N
MAPVILTLCCIFLTAFAFAQSPPSPTGADEPLTTSEMHQYLGSLKAERLQQARDALARTVGPAALVTLTNYDVQLYDIYIRVDDTADWLYGSVRFVAEATEASVTEVEADLYDNMVVDSVVGPTGTLTFTHTNSLITITLDRTYSMGEEIDFTIYYNGRPVGGSLASFWFGSYGGRAMIYSLSEPYGARTWWPCKDRMDDKADSFSIAIEVDTLMYVGSNGSLDSTVQVSPNTHVFYYTERYPMASYLFSVAIYPFVVWHQDYPYNDDLDTMLITHAVFPDQVAVSQLDTTYGGTPHVLRVLADNFGEYPFITEKYGHANFNWGGGMEHETMTSMVGWSSFGFSEPVIVHEASHQWWGDMITCKSWEDIWLNEGWASYAEAVFYLAKNGWNYYHDYMGTMKYFGDGSVWVDDTTDSDRIFSGNLSYDKGAWVVHMLRGVLGDSLFFAGVDAYYNSVYQFGAATTEDFKNVFEQATGQDLDWFFDEWIYGEYYPQFNYEVTSKYAGFGQYYHNYLWVGQVQSADRQTFTMPADVFFDYQLIADDTVSIWIDEREELYHYLQPTRVNSVSLDPNQWILRTAVARPWTLHIITPPEDISDAEQYVTYIDTIEALGGVSTIIFSIVDGQLPPGIELSTAGILSGAATDSGMFIFTVLADDAGSSYADEMEFSIYVAPRELVPGDVDFTNGMVDIGDLTFLIAYLYVEGGTLPVPNLADVNADCTIDIGDLTYLIQYLYIEGPDPIMGCVN